MREEWIEVELAKVSGIYDNHRKPINSEERGQRIAGKKSTELYPYYGATGQVGYIDDYLTDGEYVLIGEDAAPFLDCTKDVAYMIKGKTWVNNHAHILKSYFNNKFLCHYLNQFNYFGYVSGTTRLKLTQASLKKIPVKVAPLSEQRAIVSKIEELFSELDSGVANLLRAKEKLEIYRQAVLKKAFEGELTKEWREKQLDLTSVEELQNEISAERKKYIQKQNETWKNDISKWEEGGKVSSKPSKPKLREFSSKLDERDVLDLARLPDSWFYNYLAYAGDLGRGKSKHRPRNDERLFGGDYPFVQTAEVRAQDLITEYTQTYSDFGLAQSKLWPRGTLCITIAANIAETGFLGIDACFPDSVVGFTPFESIIDKRYIDYFFKFAKRKISAWAPATAQKNINLNILENIIMPFCSIDEQKQVVMEIEARLSVCDNIQTNIDNGLNTASALRQSILKRAFEGKLLSEEELGICKNNPDWKPADKLLEKIKNELRAAK